MQNIKSVDPTIAKLIEQENERQEETLMMIPSENIASEAVQEAVGSRLGNKYAEGYPYKRYYQGQSLVDQIETIAKERAEKLFGVPHANVQPYSGSPANMAVLLGLVEPHETILGLALSSGGHLTHGAAASQSGKLFNAVNYGVTKGGFIDYDAVEELAKKHKPKLIIAGTTAYPRIINWKRFGEIATKVGAYLLTDVSHIAGLIVGGAYPSPVPYCDVVMTTTHKSLRGPRGAMILITKKGLKKDPELADKIDKAVFPGLQGGPHMNAIAGIAVALKEASSPQFKTYAKQIVNNARALAEVLDKKGHHLVSGGTDSHLILMDLRNIDILGTTAAIALEEAGIVANKNSVPFDTNPPFYPSGLRLGTPGITSRGMKEKEARLIGEWMDLVLKDLSQTKKKLKYTTENEKKKVERANLIKKTKSVAQVRAQVQALCKRFPIKKRYH